MNHAERHRWARPILVAAWLQEFPDQSDPNNVADLCELQILHAQGGHEGWFGFATTPAGWEGSNNWGACDYLDGDENKIPGCTGFFESTDHKADGTVITVRFRTYATPVDGARDLVHEALKRRGGDAVIDFGNLTRYATTLRANHYFVAPVADYAAALWSWIPEIASALGEPVAVALDTDTNGAAPSVQGGGAAPLLLVGAGLLAWSWSKGGRGRR